MELDGETLHNVAPLNMGLITLTKIGWPDLLEGVTNKILSWDKIRIKNRCIK